MWREASFFSTSPLLFFPSYIFLLNIPLNLLYTTNHVGVCLLQSIYLFNLLSFLFLLLIAPYYLLLLRRKVDVTLT
jgi:hypothetical protein